MASTHPFRQQSFAGGYISPALWGRTDSAKYQAGLAECRNLWVTRFSAVENRPGTRWCWQVKSTPTQCLPMQTDAASGFSLEIGAGYIRPCLNGLNLSAVGCPAFSFGAYNAPGQIVSASGSYWMAVNEEFGGMAPIQISSSGGWGVGAQVTLTAAPYSYSTVFTQAMVNAGGIVTFRAPGGIILNVTLNAYTSATVVQGTVDAAVPAALQNAPCANWTYRQHCIAQGNVPVTLTLSTATTFAQGQTITITASQAIFTNAGPVGPVTFTFYSAYGPYVISFTSPAWVSTTQVTGVANIAIPTFLQNVAVQCSGNSVYPDSTITWGPLGPQFPPSTPTMTIASGQGFQAGATLTLNCSNTTYFSVYSAGYQFTVHSADGTPYTIVLTGVTNNAGTWTANGICALPIPTTLQFVATQYWSSTSIAPQVGYPALWYQLTGSVVEIPTYMPSSVIGALQWAEENDVLTLTAQGMAPMQVLYWSTYRWQAVALVPQPSILPPVTTTCSAGNSGTGYQMIYVVTAVSAATGEESLPSNPCYCIGNTPTTSASNLVYWSPVPGAISYNVYKYQNGVPGLIGSTSAGNVPVNVSSTLTGVNLGFVDTGAIPNVAAQPPAALPMFQTVNDYPAVCGFFQQRLLLGNTVNQPQTAWASRVGALSNFCVSTPTQDNDAMQFTIAGREVQPIQAFIDLGKLIIHTSYGEYVCTGNAFGALTPTSGPGLTLQGGCGASSVRPAIVGNADIFIQARGSIVRDLRYNIRSYAYAGKDLSLFAADLFVGRTVVAMAYQQVPNSIVWFVMSDGSLLSMTYISEVPGDEASLVAWSTHDTGGDSVQGAWVVQEGSQDVLYLQIARATSNGTQVYVERMLSRDLIDTTWLTDACFCDSAQFYDGRNTGTATMTLTSQTGGWTPQDTFLLTCSTGVFASTDTPTGNPQGVANTIVLRLVGANGIDTARLYFTIQSYTDSRHVQVTTNANVPTWARGAALMTWGKAVHAFTGMDHLNGRTLSILGDGNVLSSPNTQSQALVSAGSFTIPGAQPGADPNAVNALVVCAGLPIVAEMTTLPLENQRGDSILGGNKRIATLDMTLHQSRGGLFGQVPAPPTPITLTSWKQRQLEILGSPTALFTGTLRPNNMRSVWGTRGYSTGQAVIQQNDPVPFGMSGVTLHAEVGEAG